MEMDRLGLKDLIINTNNLIRFILAKLQRCREEREKIIQEKEFEKLSSAKRVDSTRQ
jgi:hypothetical protein